MKNSIKQLMRRPAFLISFVLLMFSCAFLCLSAGLWANARQSMREAEGAFTTIAFLNDDSRLKEAVQLLRGSFKIGPEAHRSPPMIYGMIDENGYIRKELD